MNGEHDAYVKAVSTHTFLWPFTFEDDYYAFDKETPHEPPAENWHYDDALQSGKGERFLDAYMVAQYFNTQARKIFTDIGMGQEKGKEQKAPPCLRFLYDESVVEKMTYLIGYRKDESQKGEPCKYVPKSYKLKLHSVRLFLFVPFGIGILVIDAMNDNGSYKLPDIMKINDFGRRIRLPFIPRTDGDIDADGFMVCAEKLGVVIRDDEQVDERWVTDFRVQIGEIGPENSKQQFAPAEFIYGFLSGRIGTAKKERIFELKGVTPASDDRMFLVSMIKDAGLSDVGRRINALLEEKEAKQDPERDDLYSVVFADPGAPTCVDPVMQNKLLRKAVYRRWSSYRTLYAATSLSCMCVTNPSAPLDSVCRSFLTEYTDMAILVLAQRVSIEKFAQDAADVVRGAEKKGTLKDEQITQMMELHERYVTWQNQINLFEVTDQEQGVEMYALLREQMGVNGRVKALAGQLDDMYAIANVDQNTNTNDIVAWFAIIAIVMNLASFVLELTETGKRIFVLDETASTGVAEFVFGLFGINLLWFMTGLQYLSVLLAFFAVGYLCRVKFLKKY